MSISLDTPTLYALNKDGSYQVWNVTTDGDEVVVSFGKENGKFQKKRTKCEMKNVGRSNETAAVFQAILEARSKWEKQVRLGYRETKEELQTEENFSPMLAHDAIKRSSSIIYPAYVQPKLDGVRALVTLDKDGIPVFNSRGNKTYPVQGALLQQVKELAEHSGFDKLDGELYIHGLSLQKIVALAKKWRTPEQIEAEIEKDYQADIKRRDKAIENKEPTWKDHEGEVWTTAIFPVKDVDRFGGYSSLDLEYHIFDIPVNAQSPWYSAGHDGHRLCDLDMVAMAVECDLSVPKIKIVHGEFVKDEASVKRFIGYYMEAGFEGVIIRNFKGVYEFGQRSSDLQKWKLFQDGEAKVLDSVQDKNGEGVLLCEEKDGTRFNCKMKGTHDERSQEKMLLLVGKFINFTFQSRTDDGVPQFPVGQSVRELDTLTWSPIY